MTTKDKLMDYFKGRVEDEKANARFWEILIIISFLLGILFGIICSF